MYCVSSKHGTNISHISHPFSCATQKHEGKVEALPCTTWKEAFLLHRWGAKIIPVAGDFVPPCWSYRGTVS